MRARSFSFVLMTFLALPAMGQNLCVEPLHGSEPLLNVEQQRIFRLASDPLRIPGYDGLVVAAHQRQELYEIRGHRYLKIEADFPHVWGYANKNGIHVAPNGDAFGFGWKPRQIYHLPEGAAKWKPVPSTRDYFDAIFDKGSGNVYLRRVPGPWSFQIEDGRLVATADLPVSTKTGAYAKAVRTVPEIGGTLALTGPRDNRRGKNALWFRPDGATWREINIDLPQGTRMMPDFEGADITLQDDILRIFPAASHYPPLFFRLEHDLPIFAGSAPAGDWRFHPESNSWIGWSGDSIQQTSERRFLFFDVNVEPDPPRAYIVRQGSQRAEEIRGLEPRYFISGTSIYYTPNVMILEGLESALISASAGLVAFTGETLHAPPDLSYERIGRLVRVEEVGDFILIQSDRGVFVLNDDLTAERIETFPVAEPRNTHYKIGYIARAESYFVVDFTSKSIFVSPDMKDFAPIKAPKVIKSFVSYLPDRAGAILVGEDRLYTLEADCTEDAE